MGKLHGSQFFGSQLKALMHLLLSQITKSQTIQFTNKITFTSVKIKTMATKNQ
jgi:hypothetical protein